MIRCINTGNFTENNGLFTVEVTGTYVEITDLVPWSIAETDLPVYLKDLRNV